MKIYVIINNQRNLPELDELIAAMWEENITYFKAGDAIRFSKCTTFSICWDKWVDDKRWTDHSKFKEYIYFELPCNPSLIEPILIETTDDAVFVDKRAFLKASYYIAKKAGGKISFDKKFWVTPDDFMNKNKDILNISFKDAIEVSLFE